MNSDACIWQLNSIEMENLRIWSDDWFDEYFTNWIPFQLPRDVIRHNKRDREITLLMYTLFIVIAVGHNFHTFLLYNSWN